MLKEQLNREFGSLSEGEVLHGCNTVIDRLLKLRKNLSAQEGADFVEKTLTKLLDPVYRERFRTILLGLNPNSPLKAEMRLRYSVYSYMATLNNQKGYRLSGMEAAVHGARELFGAMKGNSIIKLSRP